MGCRRAACSGPPRGPGEGAVRPPGSQECQLWDILGEQGHAAVSKLANLSTKLGDTQERVKSAQQLVEVDLQLAVEVSFAYLSLTSESFVGCLSTLVFGRV